MKPWYLRWRFKLTDSSLLLFSTPWFSLVAAHGGYLIPDGTWFWGIEVWRGMVRNPKPGEVPYRKFWRWTFREFQGTGRERAWI